MTKEEVSRMGEGERDRARPSRADKQAQRPIELMRSSANEPESRARASSSPDGVEGESG